MHPMMKFANGPAHIHVIVPGSKSITQRSLLIAALADGVSELSGIYVDDDLQLFINALYQLGIVTQLDKKFHTCIIAGGNGKFPKKEATLWCHTNKTLTRYLLATCAQTPGVYYFDSNPDLKTYNFGQLLNILRLHGTQFMPDDIEQLPLTIIGADSLEGGEILLEGRMISQTTSSLLMVAPFARSPLSFKLLDAIPHPFIDLTIAMMAEFGVLVHRIHQGQFMIPVPQQYQARDYYIEPDFSLAVYFLGAAALTGTEIDVSGFDLSNTKQLETNFLSTLEQMGCKLEIQNGLRLKGPALLRGTEVSFHECSDSFLIMIILALFAKDPTIISYVGAFREKDKKRMTELLNELTKMGANIQNKEGSLIIYPTDLMPVELEKHDDPKVVMALYILSLKLPHLEIRNKKCVTKIFPDFFIYLNVFFELTHINV